MDKLWRLQGLSFHGDVNNLLGQLAGQDDFPHMIVYGSDGAGKKTRVMCFLQKLFGSGVYKLKCETRVFKPQNTNTQIEYCLLSSNHHFDITPSMSGMQDRHVINKVIKETGTMANVDKSVKRYRVIVINQADKMSKEAQASLRRSMEKYYETCRIILICQHIHKLLAPIRSRCLNIKIKCPSNSDIVRAMKEVLGEVKVSVEEDHLQQIAGQSQNNLRKALLSLQLSVTLKSNKPHLIDHWKEDVKRMARLIGREHSTQTYKALEDGLYEILINCIDEGLILKVLVDEIVSDKKIPEKTLFEVLHYAAETQKTMCQGDKPIYHLLAFAGRCMVIIQQNK